MKKVQTIILLFLFSVTITAAQNTDSSDRKSFSVRKKYHIFFDINTSRVDTSYKSNAHNMYQMIADCDASFNSGVPIPDTIYINSTSSPDGPAAFNRQLAHQRALSTKAIIQTHIPQLKKSQFVIRYRVESWDVLRQIIIEDMAFPQREQMLHVLSDSTRADMHRALKQYNEGWEYYVNHHIYTLRNSSVTLSGGSRFPQEALAIVPNKHLQDTLAAMDASVICPMREFKAEPEMLQVPESRPVKNPLYIAARTNMLYDMAIVPNVGAEFYIGRNVSVVANWMYSWWKSDRVAWYWRTYGGDIGVRYWFGKAARKKPLTGHHTGLYGQLITYDFEVGKRGYLADRWTFGGGLEYGYSLPVARRLNIDFTIGIGYFGGELKEYLPIDGHYVWQVTKYRHWFGPTKAEISLVWLIGHGNENQREGGLR